MFLIFLRMNSAAASLASGSTPMSLKVANMYRKPPPTCHASSKICSRSSSETLMAGTMLSGKPKAVTECRTLSQYSSYPASMASRSSRGMGEWRAGTLYCGRRWNT